MLLCFIKQLKPRKMNTEKKTTIQHFTPGEWKRTIASNRIETTYPSKGGFEMVKKEDGTHFRTMEICHIHTNLGSNIWTAEQHANAKLICAAPVQHNELVGSTIVLEQYVKSIHDGVYTEAHQLLRMLESIIVTHKAAISKAIL